MYFIVPTKKYFYCIQKDEIGKTGWQQVRILKVTLRTEKQMWLVFCLYVLFICLIYPTFFSKAQYLSTVAVMPVVLGELHIQN